MPIPHLNGAFVAMLALSLIAPETTLAQSTLDLINDTKDPTTILTYGMGYGQTRHSGLRGINLDNIGRLRPKWIYSLNDMRGQETFPLIHDEKMYVTTHASTMAALAGELGGRCSPRCRLRSRRLRARTTRGLVTPRRGLAPRSLYDPTPRWW